MACVILYRRAPTPASKFLQRLLFNPVRTFPPSSSSSVRSFSSNPWMESDSDGHRSIEDREEMMEDMMKGLPPAGTTTIPAGQMYVSHRRACETRENGEGFFHRIDMPGLGKEDVKLTVENGQRIQVRAVDPTDSTRSFGSHFDLPEDHAFDLAGIEVEMKNGVMKMTVPKVKKEQKKDAYEVKIL